MKDYIKLLGFLKNHVKVLVLAFLFMIVATAFNGFQLSLIVPLTDKILSKSKIIFPDKIPGFFASFIDHLNNMDPMTMLKMMPLVVMIMLILKGIFNFWYGYLMNDVSQRIMRDIRYQLYQKIQNLSLDYFSKKRSGELIARITYDVQVIENAISYGVTDLFCQVLQIIMCVGFAFFIYFKAAFIIFILFPLVALPMRQIGRKLRKLSKSSQEKMADINSLLVETISGVRVVKAFSMEDYETRRFGMRNYDFYKLKMKTIRRNLLTTPITELIAGMLGVFILWWLGARVINGSFSFGVFGLFFASLMSIISPVKKLSNVYIITQQALAASERIYEVLDTQPSVVEKHDATVLSTISQGIDIKNVSFRYDAESDIVLKNINLTIKAGELVAIVGPTGSGKTTLANLIPRFYDPSEGTVLIDGHDLKNVSLKSVRGQIGIVTQETILFNDTVKSNIAYGHLEAPMADIERAANRAFAHQFIMELPQGYYTVIGDRGFRLSGGEKQRIAIARAILKNPPILILDEATSQLDSQSEKYVQDALDDLMQGRTVICIAHRLSTILKADKIVVLEDGKIIGMGRHEELLKSCGLYERLYKMQFSI